MFRRFLPSVEMKWIIKITKGVSLLEIGGFFNADLNHSSWWFGEEVAIKDYRLPGCAYLYRA